MRGRGSTRRGRSSRRGDGQSEEGAGGASTFHRAPQGARGRERVSRVQEVPAPFSTKGR
jgi:hypothetical protein